MQNYINTTQQYTFSHLIQNYINNTQMKLTFAAFNCLKVFQTVKLIVLNQKKLKHQILRFAQILDSCKEL